jgi:hypothetical protein
MLYMSQAEGSPRAHVWIWAQRPFQAVQNPVKRYLGNRSVGPGLWKRPSSWLRVGGNLRPAH